MVTQPDQPANDSSSVTGISPVPKYLQLREILKEQILKWGPNQPIPSESQLCSTYSVSRTTVRKAIDYLIYEGLVYRVQGKGTFVAPPKLPGRYVHQSAGFFEDAVDQGLPQKTVVLEQHLVPANLRVAGHLDLAPGEEIFRLVRLRFIGEETSHISKAHIPHRLCPGIALEDFSNQSLYRVMRQKYDINIHHGTRWIEAHLCTDEEAELLQIPPASPLLVVIGTMYDENNQPVEFGYAKNRGDRSQVEIQVVHPE